ncbi:hypothetical protein I3843_05G061100 [Carya illinoinensis]|nr:hypothetical protein I3843_05G061100 [Carya illinoinensis]
MALTFCPSVWVEAGCSKEQNRALLEIRNSTHGLAFDDFDGSHCCHSRHSIWCDKDHVKVTSIVLSMDHMKVPSITWYPNDNLPSTIFSNQSKISKFKISGNRLEGVLSFSIFVNASSLHHLDLSNKKLEVETESPSWVPTFQLEPLNLTIKLQPQQEECIPCTLFFHMNITGLHLSGNKIDGSFLDCSANGTSPLESLDIFDNHVKGSLPENIGYLLPSLIRIDMSLNALEGNIPLSFGCPPLHGVDFSHNMLLGTVPQNLTSTGTRLMLLDLSNNKLQGQMLPKDANMTMLRILRLSSNHFEGVISPTILKSQYLLILDVRDNDLSGNIPEWLYDHSRFVALILSGNRFEGHLTQRLYRMKTLQAFVISRNRLSGGIPSNLDNITFWCWEFVIWMMTAIDLSFNQLTGSIPFEMGELSQLRFLNLLNNSLIGFIPISFQNLRSLECLDLSHNHLRGRIPSKLVALTSLSVFIVAYNNLSGRIPFECQFSTFTSQCYEGNTELCEEPLPRKCLTTNQSELEEKQGIRTIDHPNFLFYAFVTVSYALRFWAFCGILIIKKNWRHKYFRAVDGYIESLFEMLS